MKFTAILFITVLFFGMIDSWLQSAISQPTVTGTWQVTSKIGSGRILQATLDMEQQDENIKGTWTRQGFPSQSLWGTIVGDSVHPTIQGKDREGRAIFITLSGKVNGQVIEGKMSFKQEDGTQRGTTRSWSAKRIDATAPSKASVVEKQKRRVVDLPETQLKERFQAELNAIRSQDNFPGAIAAFLLDDGRSAVVATGYADQEHNMPMTPNGRMLAGSIGKTFVAAVALDLVQEGKLDLNTLWKGRQGKTHYGSGVSISETDLGTTYGHDGWFPGYRSKVAYFPEFKMAIAVQVNTDVQVDLGSYVSQLADILLTDVYE